MTDSVKEHLLAAFRYLLKPLVRIALKNGVSSSEFSEAVKEVYVVVAAKELKLSVVEPNEERISWMTGVATAEVRRISQSNAGAEFASAVQRQHPLPNLLTAWHTNPNFAGPYGVCRDLKYDPKEREKSANNEFGALAAAACPGIDPGVVLDELLRTGCVTPVGDNYYRVEKRSYVPEPLSAASILLFSQMVHNFCETAEQNLRAPDPRSGRMMQRIIFGRYGITKNDLEKFDKFIRIRGQSFADDVDNWLTDLEKQDGDERIHTGIGMYQYIVNEDDELAISNKFQIQG